MRLTLCVAGLLSIFFLLFPTGQACGRESGHVVLVCIDRMSVEDLFASNLPTFKYIRTHGALGLMNTNTGGGRSSENAYLSIGTGARALATGAGFAAFNVEEMYNRALARDEFRWRTGVAAPPDGVVHLKVARLINYNANLPYPVQIGALGDALQGRGLTTCVLGNQDWEGERRRQAVMIAMDHFGRVTCGDVGIRTVRADTAYPGWRRTDYNKLFELFERFYEHTALTVIELGDWARLDEVAAEMLPGARSTYRSRILAEMDAFLGRLLDRVDLQRDLVLIISPTPPQDGIKKGDLLTPVALLGYGAKPGLAVSSSTRREGIILNVDIAPTILTFLGIKPPPAMSGGPVSVALHQDAAAYLFSLNDQLVIRHKLRVPVIQTYMVFQIAVVLFSLALIVGREFRLAERLRVRSLLLVTMGFPLACLLVPLLPFSGAMATVLVLLVWLVVIGGLAFLSRRETSIGPLALLCTVTALAVVFDLLLGAPLQKQSMLGYDPLGGARFYGLGNEYMGVLVGATILACGLFLTLVRQPSRRFAVCLTAFIFAACLYCIAAPGVGANLGGAITAAMAFLVTLLGFFGIRFRWPLILALVGSIPLVIVILAAVDFLRGAEQSHIGRAAALILGGGGWPAAFEIVQRKLAMNLKLIKYTIWTKVFMVSLGGLALLFYRPLGRMQSFRMQYPYLYAAFVGIIVASITALVFNDSGIVAAATTMVFGALPLLYLFLDPGV